MKMQILCLAVGMASLMSSALAAPPHSSNNGRLAVPRNVRHTAASPAHLRVEWDDVATGETGYRIWRREAGGEWYLAGTTGPGVTHFVDGGMKPSTNYEHRVAAFDKSGAEEAAVSAATSTLPMPSHLAAEVLIPAGKKYPSGPSAVSLKSGELLLAYQTGNAEHRKNHANASIWLRSSRDDRTAKGRAPKSIAVTISKRVSAPNRCACARIFSISSGPKIPSGNPG
jgi:hypothetical protein